MSERFYTRCITGGLLLGLLTLILISCSSSPQVQEKGTQQKGTQQNGTQEKRVQENVYLDGENVGGQTQLQVLEKVREHAAKNDIEPQDASLDPETWEVAVKEKNGQKVNVEKTLGQLLAAAEGGKVTLVMETVRPKVTAKALGKKIVKIGGYATPLLDRTTPRVNNIDIAAERLDFVRLAPGEEFSFNRTTGRRTEAKGYEEAPIIKRTKYGSKKGKGVGGGVCQLASTLYNAVEKAELDVTERHEHSKDVPYVADGMDATVSYGAVDLKFCNSRNYPIMIRTYLANGRLTVRIYENRNP
jgi:vancomycin resistance protein YoaR